MKNKSKPKYKIVWTCDFCNEEFKTKKESDQHELDCVLNPKNKKFLLNTSPKKAWIFFWLTTISVFFLTCLIFAKFVESKIILLNNNILLGVFLGNIIIGIIAFLGIAFSEKKPKNNQLGKFIKYIFFICFVYLIINPSIFAIEGYKAKANPDYRDKYFNEKNSILSSNLAPTPTLPITELQNTKYDGKILTGYILNKSNKPIFNTKISLRISKDRSSWDIDEQHDFIVPYKINPGETINFSENYKTTKKDPWWTTLILETNFYNGESVLTPTIKPTLIPKKVQSNTTISNNSNQIECIGPDGKHFNTSMTECKNLAESWGKSVDYMTNCNYPAECGGGTKREPYSECQKPCTRVNNTNPQTVNIQQSSNNQSNKTAVFLTSSNYTIYCPSQNVGAVTSIDATMKTKIKEFKVKNIDEFTEMVDKKDINIHKALVNSIINNIKTRSKKHIHMISVCCTDSGVIFDITLERKHFIDTLKENLKYFEEKEMYEDCVKINKGIELLSK